jgi:hypothetical protein
MKGPILDSLQCYPPLSLNTVEADNHEATRKLEAWYVVGKKERQPSCDTGTWSHVIAMSPARKFQGE